MTDVFVAAGSNVNPVGNLRAALTALRQVYPTLRLSPAYRNSAVGFEGADFINLVVGFSTDDPVVRVREQLQKIEGACGRPPGAPKWAPRTMDLDILLYGQTVSDTPGLILPRPDLVRRPYVLKPMAELAPEVMHPTLQRSMRELWAAFDSAAHPMARFDLESGDAMS